MVLHVAICADRTEQYECLENLQKKNDIFVKFNENTPLKQKLSQSH